MKKIKKLLALALALVTALTPILSSPVFAAGDNITVTVSVEKFTVNGQYIVEPTLFTIQSGTVAGQALIDLLKQKYPGIQYPYGGTVNYISSIYDPTYTGATPTYTNFLSEKDEGPQSGWMFSVNNILGNQGAGEHILQDGDVMRWQYTCVGLGADIGGSAESQAKESTFANKDALTRKVAEIRAASSIAKYNVGGAYDGAMTVLKNLNSSQGAVSVLLSMLNSLDDPNPKSRYTGVSRVEVAGVTAARSGDNAYAVTLPYGTTVTPGSFRIQKDSKAIISTITSVGSVWRFTITAEDGKTKADYTVTVSIADPEADNFIYTIPTNLTYNGSPQSVGAVTAKPGLELGTITVKYEGADYTKSVTPPTNAGSYDVTANGIKLGTMTINKANLTISDRPTASEVDEGAKLSDSKLTGTSEYGTFAWTFPNTVLVKSGEHSVTFTPKPEILRNYIVSPLTLNVQVTVKPKTIVAESDWEKAKDDALSYILSHTTEPIVGSVGGEWAILARARANKNDTAWNNKYLTALDTELAKPTNAPTPVGTSIKSVTDWARVTLAVSALGLDASNYKGRNLTAAFKSFSSNNTGSLNNQVFALIALNSKGYPGDTSQYVNYIIGKLINNQGWNVAGGASPDVDGTAMAIQTLAKYYSQANVKTAVDKALTWLKNQPVSDVEGNAQIIVALSALKLDAADYGGKNYIAALLTYFDNSSGGFKRENSVNQMATEQAAYALVAYDRYKNNKNTLYDMSDTGTLSGSAVTDKEAVDLAATALTWNAIKGGNTKSDGVIEDLSLPTFGENDVTISWKSSNANVITASGIVTRPKYAEKDENVTLTATITTQAEKKELKFNLTVKKLENTSMKVNFRLVGDSVHDSADKHSKYVDWIPMTTVTIEGKSETKVLEVFNAALKAAGLTANIRDNNNYVASITKSGVKLAEFDNGPNSGWMYMVGGTHPGRGLNDYTIKDGDTIVWHYTDDYTKEQSAWEAAFPNGTPKGLGDDGKSDASLKSLTISVGALSPAFKADVISYSATVENSVTSITISATANNSKATVDGAGKKNLNEGENVFTIKVTAEDGKTTKSYKITVTREEKKLVASETVTVKGTVDSNGKLTASVSADDMADAIETAQKAVDEAVAKGEKDVAAEVRLVVSAESGTKASSAVTKIDTSGIRAIAGKKDLALTVETTIGTMTLDSAALAAISGSAKGASVDISIETVDTEKLTAAQKEAVGDRPVYDFTVMSGGSAISNFNGGIVKISIPYTLKSGEKAENIKIYYLADDGELIAIAGTYSNGRVTFTVNHFSKYVIAYKEPEKAVDTTEWENPYP
ncbi:MAG: DUF4430 domain-containing protein, partial [Oscillospiraceae bacterium]|nr:DUF4430 domain-containing protein [Oscillospiraceae bacterium]